jgi:hypothetical protein
MMREGEPSLTRIPDDHRVGAVLLGRQEPHRRQLRHDLALVWRQVTGELQYEAQPPRVCRVLGYPFDLQRCFGHRISPVDQRWSKLLVGALTGADTPRGYRPKGMKTISDLGRADRI